MMWTPRGAELYDKFMCSDCHSPEADGSGAGLWMVRSDLRYMPADIHDQFLAIVIADVTGRTACLVRRWKLRNYPLVKTKMSVADANAIHA